MLLFTAIDFDSKTKDRLTAAVREFQNYTHVGRYTPRDNFHLTLVFIGETQRGSIPGITRAIDETAREWQDSAIDLAIEGSGKFHREGGDIWWVGIRENPALRSLYRMLAERLSVMGFEMDKREYRPHVTLARSVVLQTDEFNKSDFDEKIGTINFRATKISLMRSDRQPGEIRYSEIYKKEFADINLNH